MMKKTVRPSKQPVRLCATRESSVPRLFDLNKAADERVLQKLLASHAVRHIRDTYKSQAREVFLLDDPARTLRGEADAEFERTYRLRLRSTAESNLGRWVFYPWLSTLVHILEEDEFSRVRSSRNRPLISASEQKALYGAHIGIIGMSIGNGAALSIAIEGGARNIRLADFDTLELSNLNRIRAGVDALGVPKVEVTARQIYLLNPYARIKIFSGGIDNATLRIFFNGLDVVVDEFDDFAMKRRVREEAKRNRVALVSGADVGDVAVIDVERYDLDAALQPFHGRLPEKLDVHDKAAVGRAIAELVGLENHGERMLTAHTELGKSIISWPQLATASALNGAAIAYAVRRILTKQPLADSRIAISLEAHLDPSLESDNARIRRAEALADFKRMLK
jgi:hypothetical protein